jgi:hypothetical protein
MELIDMVEIDTQKVNAVFGEVFKNASLISFWIGTPSSFENLIQFFNLINFNSPIESVYIEDHPVLKVQPEKTYRIGIKLQTGEEIQLTRLLNDIRFQPFVLDPAKNETIPIPRLEFDFRLSGEKQNKINKATISGVIRYNTKEYFNYIASDVKLRVNTQKLPYLSFY